MPYEPTFDHERIFERCVPFAVLGFGATLLISMGLIEPSQPLPNETAFGCYASRSSAPILINASGVQPMDGQTPVVPFHLELDDGGILLWPDLRLTLTEGASGSSFQIFDAPGQAFLFVVVVNGVAYGEVNAAKLETFQFFTKEGTGVAFRRVAPETCADPA